MLSYKVFTFTAFGEGIRGVEDTLFLPLVTERTVFSAGSRISNRGNLSNRTIYTIVK